MGRAWRDRRRLRGGASAALRLRHAGEAAGGGGRGGRGWSAPTASAADVRRGGAATRRARPSRWREVAIYRRRGAARGAGLRPRSRCAGRSGRRAGDHRRADGDHRGRARLAGDGGWPAHIWCCSGSRRCRSGSAIGTDGRSGDAGGVQQPLHGDRRADGRRRCRTPPIRSTSKSGWISPARCSTARASLIANAPHMPVHLGSMGESVQTSSARGAAPARGWPRHAAGRRLCAERAL